MTEIDLEPGPENMVEIRVQTCAQGMGLEVRRLELKSYPGCTHWHFNRPGSVGTLEATWWPKTGRLWLKVASNRHGDWIDETINHFKKEFVGK